MQPPTTQPVTPEQPNAEALVARSVPVPSLELTIEPQALLDRLDVLARRGRLAGFRRGRSGGPLFTAEAWGTPFDGVVGATLERDASGAPRLRFVARLRPVAPALWAVAMVLSVWPGVWMTESFLASVFTSWPAAWKYTYWWYLPLAIVGAPWAVWVAWARSLASVHDSAHRVARRVAAEIPGARPAPTGTHPEPAPTAGPA